MDPNKPIDSQGSSQNSGGPSQLSPQIKVSPPNLPISSAGSSIPHAPPLVRSIPTAPSIAPTISPPVSPADGSAGGPTSTTGRPPVAPAQTGQQPIFKSSIRTMQEDMAAIKRGQSPSGFKIEKESEKEQKPALPSITPPPRVIPVPQVELGRLEKSKLLPGTAPLGITKSLRPSMPSMPPKELGKETISIPAGKLGFLPKFSGKKLNFLLGILILVIGGVIAFIFLRNVEPEVTLTPTPRLTAIASPTPTVVSLEQLFPVFSSLNLAGGADFFARLENLVSKESLAGGEPGLYAVSDPQNNLLFNFASFLSAASVTVPQNILSFTDQSFYVSLKLKADTGYSRSIISKLKNTTGLNTALMAWENNISADLDELFGLDISKAASVRFLDNTYNGLAIRYMNFSDPTKTIDIAVVTVNGDIYLVLSNSREHIYSLIDKMR